MLRAFRVLIILPKWAYSQTQSESINNVQYLLTMLNTYHWRDSKITQICFDRIPFHIFFQALCFIGTRYFSLFYFQCFTTSQITTVAKIFIETFALVLWDHCRKCYFYFFEETYIRIHGSTINKISFKKKFLTLEIKS